MKVVGYCAEYDSGYGPMRANLSGACNDAIRYAKRQSYNAVRVYEIRLINKNGKMVKNERYVGDVVGIGPAFESANKWAFRKLHAIYTSVWLDKNGRGYKKMTRSEIEDYLDPQGLLSW